MQLNDAGQQVASRPSPNPTVAPGYFNNAPAMSPPTIVDADLLNAVMAELLQFLSLTGQTASKLNVAQVATGTLMLFGTYGLDSGGTANAYIVTPPTALPGLQDGQLVRMWTTRSNTAGATLQLSPLSAQPIVYSNGAALVGGEIAAGLNEFVWNQGLNAFVLAGRASSSTPHGEEVLTASGNFTVPSGVFQVFQQVQGGGGGGAGATTGQQGGCGGAGGYSEGWVTVTPGQVIAVTIGGGGAGVGANASGGIGGSTVAGAMTGHGGAGGENSASFCAGGGGGVGAGGTLNVAGGDGGDGQVGSAVVGEGAGGASFFGGGGRAGAGGGVAARAYGAGGGGAYSSSGNGGAGMQGVAIFKW